MATSKVKSDTDKEAEILKSLSAAALADYKRLKARKNVQMKGVPMWIINKDLRGGYKKSGKTDKTDKTDTTSKTLTPPKLKKRKPSKYDITY